jgi:hypothetical protein
MTRVGLVVVVALVVACHSGSPRGDGERGAAERPGAVAEGTLRGGLAGIGGEHTGWLLEQAGAPGLEVDVSAVRAEAERLAGRRVRVVGRTATRPYVERGPTAVLVVDAITLLP